MTQENTKVDLDESSIYGPGQENSDAAVRGDTASDDTLDRLERLTGGAEEPAIFDGDLAREADALEASTDEEIDALGIDLLQDEEVPSRDGSGHIVDDVAEEQLAGFTEVGPDAANRGGISVAPGREDTSSRLRSHHPDTSVTRSESIVEGNLDEPSDETRTDAKVDEGRGA
jgi:hypothetical protein